MGILGSIQNILTPSDADSTDAVMLLKGDHRAVEDLFKQFEDATQGSRKVDIAKQICWELGVHATIEEEIFYPAALAVLDEKEGKQIWEGTVEHGTLHGLIAALAGMSADDPSFDSHVKVLNEYVAHHVKEEENTMFPTVRAAGLDMEEIGARMQARKNELNAQPQAPKLRH